VAEDRAVFHKAIAEKYPLSSHNVSTAKEALASRILHHFGNRWLVVVRVKGKHPHDEEADHQNKARSLNPAAGNHSRPLFDRLQ